MTKKKCVCIYGIIGDNKNVASDLSKETAMHHQKERNKKGEGEKEKKIRE